MTQQDHIDYWLKNSERDWERAEMCFNQKDYVFCLFCLHLALEKICKGFWVYDKNENHPPRIHNLEKILRQTSIELSQEDWDLLVNMNRFNLEGRYPDYRDLLYKECTNEFTEQLFNEVKKIKICLLKKLQ
jgi:AbiV family abortive infection protein